MSDIETWTIRSVVGAIVAAAIGLFLRVRTNENRLAVAEKSIEDLWAEREENKARNELLIRIDERLQHLPSRDDIQTLHNRISENGRVGNDTRTQVAAMAEKVEGLRTRSAAPGDG